MNNPQHEECLVKLLLLGAKKHMGLRNDYRIRAVDRRSRENVMLLYVNERGNIYQYYKEACKEIITAAEDSDWELICE